MDLNNIQVSDLKDKLLQFADKKTLIKFGIGFGSMILFLLIYYIALNPIVKSKKAMLDDKLLKEAEISQFNNDINSFKIKFKKIEPEYKKNISYYKIPVDYEIRGNFLGYIKFKRELAKSNKMLNFDKETIKVVPNDKTGAILASGVLTIVGLTDEFF